jgi:hypothetical protein
MGRGRLAGMAVVVGVEGRYEFVKLKHVIFSM